MVYYFWHNLGSYVFQKRDSRPFGARSRDDWDLFPGQHDFNVQIHTHHILPKESVRTVQTVRHKDSRWCNILHTYRILNSAPLQKMKYAVVTYVVKKVLDAYVLDFLLGSMSNRSSLVLLLWFLEYLNVYMGRVCLISQSDLVPEQSQRSICNRSFFYY